MTGQSLTYRLLHEWSEIVAASDLIHRVWGDPSNALAPAGRLRTHAHAGNPLIGAFEGDMLCGTSFGFLAPGGGLHLHSDITGVLPGHQHRGVGFGLKVAQREWCLTNGIDLVTWTFDPLIARNAHFNMHKLAATSDELLPNFYGAMDDVVNAGEETDRLFVRWLVGAESTVAAVDAASSGRPRPEPAARIERTVAVPADHVALRAVDPEAARTWRAAVRDQLLEAFAAGLEIVDFDRADGYRLAARA